MSYNVEVLRYAADNYCQAEADYRQFAIRYNAAKRSGEYYENAKTWEGQYWEKYTSANCAWEKLSDMCRLVGADWKAVLAVEKSIRRYSQYRRGWDFCPSLRPSWWEEAGSAESYQRIVAEV